MAKHEEEGSNVKGKSVNTQCYIQYEQFQPNPIE